MLIQINWFIIRLFQLFKTTFIGFPMIDIKVRVTFLSTKVMHQMNVKQIMSVG